MADGANDVGDERMTATDERSFQKLAAVTAILSAPVAYVAEGLGFTAIDWDPTAFSEPGTLIALGTEGATLFRWGWRLDIFGYYLLIAPAVVFLGYWLRPKRPLLVTLLTLGGLTYVFLGALGAAINATVWPELMAEYAGAGPERRAMLEVVFGTYATVVVIGLWGILARTVSAIWWIGIGLVLREERRHLGWFTILLGAFAAIAGVGNLLVVAPLTGLGTMGFLLLAPAWALWLGVDLWRRPVDSDAVRTGTLSPADEIEVGR